MTEGKKTFLSPALAGKLRSLARPLGYALLGFALFQWFGSRSSGPKQGSAAAEFSLEVVGRPSERITCAELRGQPVILEVFASWCKACRSMAPKMAELAKAPRKRAVRFVGVALDTTVEDALEMQRAWGIPFTVALADAAFSSNYQIQVLPTIIVLDADGRVAHVTTGSTRASTIDGWLEDLGAARIR